MFPCADPLEAVCVLPALWGVPQVVHAPWLWAEHRPRWPHSVHQGVGVLQDVWIGRPWWDWSHRFHSSQRNRSCVAAVMEMINLQMNYYYSYYCNDLLKVVVRFQFLLVSRAVGILQRLAALSPGGSGGECEDPTPPQGPVALVLRESPPHPRRHLGARLLAAVSGLHQAICANLKLTGYPRYKRILYWLLNKCWSYFFLFASSESFRWQRPFKRLVVAVYLNLSAFTRPSPLSAVILNSSRRLSLLAVCVGVLSETCVSQAGKRLLLSDQDAWTLAWTPLRPRQMLLISGKVACCCVHGEGGARRMNRISYLRGRKCKYGRWPQVCSDGHNRPMRIIHLLHSWKLPFSLHP